MKTKKTKSVKDLKCWCVVDKLHPKISFFGLLYWKTPNSHLEKNGDICIPVTISVRRRK